MTATDIEGERIAALSFELEDALALWTAGRVQLQQMRPEGAGVVLALLSAGAEKLLKLTLGLNALDTDGAWPTVQVMRTQWGHRIAALDEHVLALLRSRTTLSAAQPFITAVLDRTATDPIRTEVFGTLQAYACAGRFAHLDTLAGSVSAVASPRQRWDELSTALAQQQPGLLDRLADPRADFAASLAELGAMLDQALQWWQYACTAAGSTASPARTRGAGARSCTSQSRQAW